MKFSLISLAIVSALSFSSVASADHIVPGVNISGNVNAATDLNFRGLSLSDENPTVGFGVAATHNSGLFASLDVNTANVSGVSGSHQYLSAITLGHNTDVGAGIKLGSGFKRYQFNGDDDASDMTFNEVYVTAGWKGLEVALYHNVDGAKGGPDGFATGDTYATVGYTHYIDKYSVGADVGYYWYDNNEANDGIALAQVRAGYQVNSNLSLGVAYQLDGMNAADQSQERNHTARFNVGYSF